MLRKLQISKWGYDSCFKKNMCMVCVQALFTTVQGFQLVNYLQLKLFHRTHRIHKHSCLLFYKRAHHSFLPWHTMNCAGLAQSFLPWHPLVNFLQKVYEGNRESFSCTRELDANLLLDSFQILSRKSYQIKNYLTTKMGLAIKQNNIHATTKSFQTEC